MSFLGVNKGAGYINVGSQNVMVRTQRFAIGVPENSNFTWDNGKYNNVGNNQNKLTKFLEIEKSPRNQGDCTMIGKTGKRGDLQIA